MDKSELYTEVMTVVRAKSKRLAADVPDTEIQMGIEETEQAIKTYCQIPKVPIQLLYTWANMTIDLLLYVLESNTVPDEVIDAVDPSEVATIHLGDTSISLGDRSRSNQRGRTLKSHQANLDSLIMNYRAQLNQFRRIL